MKNVKKKSSTSKMILYYLMGVLAGLLGIVAMARIIWHSKFYPNIYVGGVAVGGLTWEEGKQKIETYLQNKSLTLSYNGYNWELPTKSVSTQMDATLNTAYRVGRRLNFGDYGLLFVNQKQLLPILMSEGVSEDYNKIIDEVARTIEIPVIPPTIAINNQKVVVTNGSDGVVIDSTELINKVKFQIAYGEDRNIEIPTKVNLGRLDPDGLNALSVRATGLVGNRINLNLDDRRETLDGDSLVTFLSTDPSSDQIVDVERVREFVEGIAEGFNRESENAKFSYSEGRVTEFAAGKDGIKVNVELTTHDLSDAIEKLVTEEEKTTDIKISAERTNPEVTMDKVNELGIKERIGRGESYYAHSIPNRIYNVGLASSRINTALIPPGEEVSFNKLVGEVSAATGYRSAYIISQGRTVLGDGGGLCQVSTTLFRAAMNAGLPILERWGHSYRVSYYELNSKPGVDATVIAPSKDFRFKNDTPGHVLIQTINDPKNLHLVIEIYGTSDGRVASVTEPKVWGITPPLPTVYQDDPSLPAGTMKQVDWSAGGAKASFEYKVTRNGETLQEQTFSTVYRPWAAVYLRGTGQ